MGITVETAHDGFSIPGRQQFHSAEIESYGDHRIAMAFSIAALMADAPCVIHDAASASVSFPKFYKTLSEIAR